MAYLPFDDVCPLDAVLRLTWNGRKCAERHRCPWRMHVELTLNTGRHCRQNDTRLTFEALGTTINKWLQRVRVLHVHHVHQCSVYPPSCFDGIQTTNDEIKELARFTQYGLHFQRSYQSLFLDPLHPERNTSITLPCCSIFYEHSMPKITYSYRFLSIFVFLS